MNHINSNHSLHAALLLQISTITLTTLSLRWRPLRARSSTLRERDRHSEPRQLCFGSRHDRCHRRSQVGQAWDLELMDGMMTAMFVRLGGFAAQPVLELKFSSSTIIDNDSFSFSSSSGVVAAIRTTLRLRSPRVLATSSLSGSSHGSPMFSITIILWVGNHRHFSCHCDYHHPPRGL